MISEIILSDVHRIALELRQEVKLEKIMVEKAKEELANTISSRNGSVEKLKAYCAFLTEYGGGIYDWYDKLGLEKP